MVTGQRPGLAAALTEFIARGVAQPFRSGVTRGYLAPQRCRSRAGLPTAGLPGRHVPRDPAELGAAAARVRSIGRRQYSLLSTSSAILACGVPVFAGALSRSGHTFVRMKSRNASA